MIKHFCDRCGREVPKNGQKTYVKVNDQDMEVPKGMKVEYELCMDCLCKLVDFLDGMKDGKMVEVPETGIGDLSDGYHTFNQLYYQRLILFAALVNANKERAWKSYRHEDGEVPFGGGWFIVGIETPEGSYTYHYEIKDFDLFDCKELPIAKHWDGHTEKDVTRLLSLPR